MGNQFLPRGLTLSKREISTAERSVPKTKLALKLNFKFSNQVNFEHNQEKHEDRRARCAIRVVSD